MMKTAMVAMVVMGCDCDARLCEYISETPAQWSTVAECEAELQHRTLSGQSAAYPLVTGLCRTATPEAPMTLAQGPVVSPLTLDAPATGATARYPSLSEGRSLIGRTADGYLAVRNTLGRAATGTSGVARRTGDRLLTTLAAAF